MLKSSALEALRILRNRHQTVIDAYLAAKNKYSPKEMINVCHSWEAIQSYNLIENNINEI